MDLGLAWLFVNKCRDAGVIPPPHKPAYKEHISTHIVAGLDHIVSPDTGTEWLHPPLLRIFDKARELLGRPIPITAGSRTPEHEQLMQEQGYKTAKLVSPHNINFHILHHTQSINYVLRQSLAAFVNIHA